MIKEKYIENTCKHHGRTTYVLESRGAYRCKACRSERVSKQRRKNKLQLVLHFGGKCTRCGYDKCVQALEFHHPDKNKEFGLGQSGKTISYHKLLAEALKCELVCSNCHREIHAKI